MTSATLASPASTRPSAGRNAINAATVRARQRAYVRAVFLIDAAMICLAILGGYFVRFGEYAEQFGGGGPRDETPYSLIMVGLGVVWIASLKLMRSYDARLMGYGVEEYRRVAGATVRLAGAIAIVGYVIDLGVARWFLVLSFALGIVGLVAGRFLARQWLHRARRRDGGWSRQVLVVGDAPHINELVATLRREPYAGYHVVGACIPDGLIAPVPQRLGDVPVVGSFRTVLEAVESTGVDTVAVTTSGELTAIRLRRLGWQLEGTGVDMVLAPALTDVAGPRIHTRPVAGLPLIEVEAPEFRGGRKLVKGFFDRAAALVALTVAFPVLLAIAIAIKLDGGGPVFFRQTRVGMSGKEFGVFKFRTMVVNADAMLAQLKAKNETNGLMFKMKDDPRVTRVGRFLRRYSLDELPQLANVLLGQMSLVGPRPPLPREVARYDGDVARRLLVKPGITGLWQVSGRSDLSWEDGIRLDLYYVENWTLTADLAILWKTVGAVIASRGAY